MSDLNMREELDEARRLIDGLPNHSEGLLKRARDESRLEIAAALESVAAELVDAACKIRDGLPDYLRGVDGAPVVASGDGGVVLGDHLGDRDGGAVLGHGSSSRVGAPAGGAAGVSGSTLGDAADAAGSSRGASAAPSGGAR